MPDAPVPSREGSHSAISVLSLFFTLVGYAFAGFGAVLILDGIQRVVIIVFSHTVFVGQRAVSPEFAVAVALVAAGVFVFLLGRALATLSSGRSFI